MYFSYLLEVSLDRSEQGGECENKLGNTGRRVGCTLDLMSHSKNLTYELRCKRQMIRFSLRITPAVLQGIE